MLKRTFTILSLASILLIGCGNTQSKQERESTSDQMIKVDQIGYKTHSVKIAVVPENQSDDFEIIDVKSQTC